VILEHHLDTEITMLREYKNQWFAVVQDSGIDLSLLDIKEQENLTFVIKLRNSPLVFMIRQIPDNFDLFTVTYSEYRPNYPLLVPLERFDEEHYEQSPGANVSSPDQLTQELEGWLIYVVKRYIAEKELPDLWSEIRNYSFFSSASSIPADELNQFTEVEKQQLRDSLQEFKRLITEKFDPVEDQLKFMNERLDYLTKAVERLNRFDWKAQAASTLVAIAVNLGVDTATGKLIGHMFMQALGFITGHLSSGL
jgi:hypothetical protein